jgi:prophage antirepressor-like protein
MKEIIKFFNKEKVRCFIKNNEPYFSASDVCQCLGLLNVSRALGSVEKDDITSSNVIDSKGRCQSIYFVNEPALYQLIFKSRKKESKAFKKWVTHEVLPSIRKTGKYSIPDNLKNISTKNRNVLTNEWQAHGIKKPHEFIQLTLQEYKNLNIEKKKSEMTRHEILLLSALESMESLRLFENQDVNGCYECRDNLIETSKRVLLKGDTLKESLD